MQQRSLQLCPRSPGLASPQDWPGLGWGPSPGEVERRRPLLQLFLLLPTAHDAVAAAIRATGTAWQKEQTDQMLTFSEIS